MGGNRLFWFNKEKNLYLVQGQKENLRCVKDLNICHPHYLGKKEVKFFIITSVSKEMEPGVLCAIVESININKKLRK